MVSFIYFDVGGVVIDDFSGNDGWQKLKGEIGVTPEQDEAFMKAFYPLEHEALVGRDLQSIVPELQKKFRLQVDAQYSILEAFVSRFNANRAIWPSIELARQNYRIGLLTNMYPNMLLQINNHGLMPNIAWDAIIDSSVEMYKKPQQELFEIAQRAANVPGSEILFIDNTLGHVEAAQKFGWQAYHYDAHNHAESSEKLLRYLKTL